MLVNSNMIVFPLLLGIRQRFISLIYELKDLGHALGIDRLIREAEFEFLLDVVWVP